MNTAFSKDKHFATKELFEQQWSGTRYKRFTSVARFDFILSWWQRHSYRRRNDPFPPIQELWDVFTRNYRSNCSPESYVTVDEQLLAFRGRCPFMMYIPNKPSKYGNIIEMACGTNTSYMINRIPYIGKKTQTGGLPISEYFVKEVTTSIHGTKRNVKTDNWFTSVQLGEDLLRFPYNLTLLGTIGLKRKGIPTKILTNRKERMINSSIFWQ